MLNAADGVNRCLRVISLFLSLLLIARRRVRPPNEKSHRPEPEGELWLRIQGPNFPADSKQNGWAPVRCTGWFENLTPWPRPTPARKSVGSSQEAAEAAEKSSSIPLRCLCVLLLGSCLCIRPSSGEGPLEVMPAKICDDQFPAILAIFVEYPGGSLPATKNPNAFILKAVHIHSIVPLVAQQYY